MKSWMNEHTPPTDAAISIARDLDAYHVPPQFDLSKAEVENTAAPDVVPAPEEPKEPVLKKKIDFEAMKATILRSIAVFTSASCAITSVYFSNKWFLDSQPVVVAGIMSATVVLTLTVAPELSIALARKRRWMTATVIVMISVVATVFSMSSTIGGIYNARSESMARSVQQKDDSDYQSQADAQEAILLKSRIARLEKSMETDQDSASSYQDRIDKALDSGLTQTSKEVQVLVANRNNAISRVKAGESEISKAEGRLSELLVGAAKVASESKAERSDFSSWLGARLGLSGDQMEFILAVFPAIFIDIIAPTMLVVAFAL